MTDVNGADSIGTTGVRWIWIHTLTRTVIVQILLSSFPLLFVRRFTAFGIWPRHDDANDQARGGRERGWGGIMGRLAAGYFQIS